MPGRGNLSEEVLRGAYDRGDTQIQFQVSNNLFFQENNSDWFNLDAVLVSDSRRSIGEW